MSLAVLPPLLRTRIDGLLEGVSRHDLTLRSQQISGNYRDGGVSRETILRELDGISYLLARLPATYAAVAACLWQLHQAMPDFAPHTLLDVGSGPGTASWAACEAFPCIDRVTCLDDNTIFHDLGRTLAADHPVLSGAVFQRYDLSAIDALPKAELVIASYSLGELHPPPVRRIWDATEGVLLIVEPGTPAGYQRIVEWRATLLDLGATLAAPCPHHDACPIVPPDWCHFSQRLPRSRDHMRLKNAHVPFEDEAFSYVAASRLPVTNRPQGRVLMPPHATAGGIACKTCLQGRIDRVTIPKRDKPAYKAAHRLKWGDSVNPISQP